MRRGRIAPHDVWSARTASARGEGCGCSNAESTALGVSAAAKTTLTELMACYGQTVTWFDVIALALMGEDVESEFTSVLASAGVPDPLTALLQAFLFDAWT